ncbi:MAG: serine hydroxymethyltransferase, partial [Chamaesiphon sp.]|nr:serine hydroxymethyltransferase [Chamaesiphon sp.]
MGTTEFVEIGNIIADRLLNPEDDRIANDCVRRIATLCEAFPLYPHLSTPVPALV